jgi:hypothetical protein
MPEGNSGRLQFMSSRRYLLRAIFGRLAIGLTVMRAITGFLACGYSRRVLVFSGRLATGVLPVARMDGMPVTGVRTWDSMAA